MTITPEQRYEIEQAGAVRIEDPETHTAYVILKAEVYERMKPFLENGRDEIPEGIRQSQEAFFRDLPELLKTRACWGSASLTAETSGSESRLPTSRSSGRSTAGESRMMSSTAS
jgi:hypothetical protein